MASIVKNQILKYLARYFKNLSPDQINFNTMKGTGQLAYLELDEIALTDLLELPAWMRIKSASCNRVNFLIPWTKTKTRPMIWNLDEVFVEIETCEELRNLSMQDGFKLLQQQGKYSWINGIVDGMTINVNTATVKFTSSTFAGSLQILRITVESRSCSWGKCDLRHTKIKDTGRGQILLFKEIKWELLRIEAQSITEEGLPPLRLITNDTVCRITIKKRLSDCFIMGSKLVLILRDILWVLTDSQLKAALHFVDSLSGLIKKANNIARITKAARKLEELPEYQAQVSQQETMVNKSAVSELFAKYDVIETSYHLVAKKVDLHLSDDPSSERSNHVELQKGGAIRLNLEDFRADYYPYHLAIKDRRHWPKYQLERYPHPQWLLKSQNEFKESLLNLIRTDYADYILPNLKVTPLQNGVAGEKRTNAVRKYLTTQFNKIMTMCIVLRIGGLTVDKVTTFNKISPKHFIKADKDRYSLPESEVIHAEFTYYYYPGDIQFPLPPPKFYVQLYPIQINFDVITLLWLNTFFLNMQKSLMSTNAVKNQDKLSQLLYFDMKFEAIMPHIIFDSEGGSERDRDRSLHLQVSRVCATNVRTEDSSHSRSNLAKVVNACQASRLFLTQDFPTENSDYSPLLGKFADHMRGKDNVRENPPELPADDVTAVSNMLTQDFLWLEARDVWCLHLESIWCDFYGVKSIGNRPLPFLDAFPLTLWMYVNPTLEEEARDNADIYVLASASNLISLQVDQFQAKFLMKITKELSELLAFVTIDTNKITNESSASLMAASVIPQVEVTLITASQSSTSLHSSIGDIRSSVFVPDESSIEGQTIQSNDKFKSREQKDSAPECKDWPDEAKIAINMKTCSVKISKRADSLNSPNKTHIPRGLLATYSASEDPENISVKSEDSLDIENYLVEGDANSLYHDNADLMFEIKPPERGVYTHSCRSDHPQLRNVRSDIRQQCANLDFDDANIEIADEALFENAYHTPAIEDVSFENAHDTVTPLTAFSDKDSFGTFSKKKHVVAATTFKIGPLEFSIQSGGLKSIFKGQIGDINIEECFSIPWDELQNKFTARTRDWVEIENTYVSSFLTSKIKLRFENELQPPDIITDANVENWTKSALVAVVDGLLLEIQANTLQSLGEFSKELKNNEEAKALPFQIFLNTVKIAVMDNKSSDKSIAADSLLSAVIKDLKIFQEEKGGPISIFPSTMEAAMKANSNFNSNPNGELAEDNVIGLKRELNVLRKRLATLEYLSEENQMLKQYENEIKVLRSCLNAAQDEIGELLDEKRSLLEYISKLRGSSFSSDISCKR